MTLALDTGHVAAVVPSHAGAAKVLLPIDALPLVVATFELVDKRAQLEPAPDP